MPPPRPPPQGPNPWPQHAAGPPPPPPSYPPPPPGQAWANPSWAHNQGWEYTVGRADRSFSHSNEEDWATKARAWATKSVPENQQIQQHVMPTGRTEDHHYAYHDQYHQPAGLPTEPSRLPLPQLSNEQLPFQMSGQQRETNYLQDKGPMVPSAKNFGSFPPNYDQEVSYNYSSTPGNGNAMLQFPSSQVEPSPAASSVQDGFGRAPPNVPPLPTLEQPHSVHDAQLSKLTIDPSDQPLEFNNKQAPDLGVKQTTNFGPKIPAGSVGIADHDAVAASAHPWPPSASAGFFPQASVPSQGTQMDPSVNAAPLFGAVSGSNYVPAAAFGVGGVAESFPADAISPFNAAERSKKPPVPNWLREELLKKKSAAASTTVQQSTTFHSMESEDAEKPPKGADQTDSRSIDSTKSTEDDEDDEDELEAARMAAINQEIKRVLTEVLLKVTDDLFDEIATKVLNEDDSLAETNEPTTAFGSKMPDPAESKPKASAKVLVPAKTTNISSSDRSDDSGPSSPKGALLGLANYDSDEDEDDDNGKDTVPISNVPTKSTADAAHLEEGVQNDGDGRNANRNERNSLIQSASSLEDYRLNNETEPKGELHIHEPQNGGSSATTSIQPKDVISRQDEKSLGFTEVQSQNGEFSSGDKEYKSTISNHKHLVKSSNKEDSVKQAKVVRRTERESSTAEKDNDDEKYGIYGRIDKTANMEEKGPGRNAKHGADKRESYSRGSSKHDDAKGDRKDFSKYTRERNREGADRRGEKGKDEKEDRPRQVKSSTSHSSRRSPSPIGRSRTWKENSLHGRGSVSSDEPSDNSKKRKLRSHKNSISPSPPKSRNRRVSRSPHSKHSHRRHSPYSSTDRRRRSRSRSRSPIKRR